MCSQLHRLLVFTTSGDVDPRAHEYVDNFGFSRRVVSRLGAALFALASFEPHVVLLEQPRTDPTLAQITHSLRKRAHALGGIEPAIIVIVGGDEMPDIGADAVFAPRVAQATLVAALEEMVKLSLGERS